MTVPAVEILLRQSVVVADRTAAASSCTSDSGTLGCLMGTRSTRLQKQNLTCSFANISPIIVLLLFDTVA